MVEPANFRPGLVARARAGLWFWLVVAATLWAAALRLPALGSLPPQAYVDEAWYNLTARDLLLNKTLRVFYPTSWGGMRPMLVDFSALIQALGFHSLVASRAVTAAAGVLCVPLTFVCCAELLRRERWPARRRQWVAALAALVEATLIFQVATSRIGEAPILIPLLTLLAVWQMRLAERTGRWQHWAVAGLALGLAQYVNINGLFVLAVLGLLALLDLARAAAPQRPALFGRLALMGLLGGLVALPLIVFFLRQPQWFFIRANNVSPQQNRLLFYLDNLRIVGLSFNLSGDLNARQNVPGLPMLDVIQSVGFLAGLAWALWRLRRSPSAGDTIVWLVVTALPSILTVDSPNFERMIGTAAPVCFLVGLGWVGLWRRAANWLWARWPARRPQIRRALAGAAMLLASLSLGYAAYAYYGLYPHTPGLAADFTATPYNVAQRMLHLAQAQPVFVERAPEADDSFAFAFFFPGTPVTRLDFRQCLPRPDGRAAPTTYVVLAEQDPQTTNTLAQLYPSANVERIQTESDALVGDLDIVTVPAGATLPPVPHPLTAAFAGGISLLGYDWSGPSVAAGQPLYLTLFWKTDRDQHASDTAFVHLGQGGGAATPLVAQHDGPPCQGLYPTPSWRAGDVVPDSFAVAVPAGTPPGRYPLLAGWYDAQTQQRLAITQADSALPDNRAIIAVVDVTAH